MEEFLEDHQELWGYIDENSLTQYPCGYDAYFLTIGKEYCGYDFSKEPILQFFDTGSSTCFAAIKCIDKDYYTDSLLDKSTVYIYDLGTGEEPERNTGLSLRQYIKAILQDALKGKDRIKEIREALDAIEKM